MTIAAPVATSAKKTELYGLVYTEEVSQQRSIV